MASIKVTGVGVDTLVDVPAGATIAVVLGEAGIENPDEVNVTVDGEKVTDVEQPAPAGAAVTATPKAAALG